MRGKNNWNVFALGSTLVGVGVAVGCGVGVGVGVLLGVGASARVAPTFSRPPSCP